MAKRVSRRQAARVLAASTTGALVGAAVPGAVASAGEPTPDGGPAAASRPSRVETLLAPLNAGDVLADWTVVALHDLVDGAASVVMAAANGIQFQIDVCALDPREDAFRGPARTEHFELFVANEGTGTQDTLEAQGLAAMAVAEIVRENEPGLDRTGYQTLAQRSGHAKRHVRTA